MKHVPDKKSFVQVILNQFTADKNTPDVKASGLPYVFNHMVKIYKDGGKAEGHNIIANKGI
jgi:hypothetical protein